MRLVVEPVSPDRFQLIEPLDVMAQYGIYIPAGYITDGASVPRLFWMFFPPNKPEYLRAAVIHDYVTDVLCGYVKDDSCLELYPTFKSADMLLERVLVDTRAHWSACLFLPICCSFYHTCRYNSWFKKIHTYSCILVQWFGNNIFNFRKG